ncbi:C2 and GRAM domain-containing protein At5g50170 [Linum perenne]
MKLFVYVLEARELPPVKQESYVVKLRLGKRKCKTRVLRNAIAVWNEEFQFQLHDPDADELIVSVYGHVGDGGLFSGGELVGRVSVPVRSVLVERDQSLPPTWFPLQFPGSAERVHANGGDCGKILLSMSVHEEGNDSPDKHFLSSDEDVKESETNFGGTHVSKSPHRKIPGGKKLIKAIANRLERVFTKHEEGDGGSPRTDVSSDITNASDYGDCFDEHPSAVSFEAGIQMMDSREDKQDMPDDLHGGVLLDQKYLVEPSDLNRLLFGPGSQFRKDLAEMQGTQDVEEGPWTWKSVGMCCLTRTVTYIKAASKLVKAVKATEEQSYVRVHGSEFCVFVSVVTPDVPYGNTFNVELMYKILPGPEQSSGEESCHLIISWGVTFHHSTMMKGMIEGGAKQGLKESFVQFGSLLAQNVKVLDSTSSSDKEHVLANLESVHESDLELAWHYFCNFTVASTVIMVIYVLVHILLCEPSQIQGLEFYGVDLPDSFGQLVTCAVLFIHVERVYYMATHFIEARLQQGSDHGVKSQGDGWILTVALIGGTSLASLGSADVCDPYTSTELADMWVPLEGKLAQSSQSKLHLRIFLNNNNGVETIKEYLTKMEREVGKKFNLRSPHRNSSFQKLFGLPPEEFLISDFTCQLKRKMPLQGRLFLSARIVGFYSNLFGHKTKFFFLWEDIDDVLVLPPTLSSVGSPMLMMVLRKDKGTEARQWAKSQDEHGRLEFYFQSFASFGVASRTIMALWRTRTLTPEQKALIAEEQEQDQGERHVMVEDSTPIVDAEDAKMTRIYSEELPISVSSHSDNITLGDV